MPARSQEPQIAAALRELLPSLIQELEPITHERLLKLLRDRGVCGSRKTYFKYVRDGTQLRADVEHAIAEQVRKAGRGRSKSEVIRELRAEVDRLTQANRCLLLEKAAFVDALVGTHGVPVAVVQAASRATLTAPGLGLPFRTRGRRAGGNAPGAVSYPARAWAHQGKT